MTTILVQLNALSIQNTATVSLIEQQLKTSFAMYMAIAPELRQDDARWKLKYIKNIYLGGKEPELLKETVHDWDKAIWRNFQVAAARMTLDFDENGGRIRADTLVTRNLLRSVKTFTGEYAPDMPLGVLYLDSPDENGRPALASTPTYWLRTDINEHPERYAIVECRLTKHDI